MTAGKQDKRKNMESVKFTKSGCALNGARYCMPLAPSMIQHQLLPINWSTSDLESYRARRLLSDLADPSLL